MDHALMKTGRKACKHAARIIVSVAIVFMLIWILQTGYELVTKPRRDTEGHDSENDYIALVFGVATVIFGMVYFIVGLSIVGELALDFLAWLQAEDVKFTNRQEKEGTCQVYIQGTVTIVSVFMFTWAMYHGCKLAAETPKGGIHSCLTFVIGFTTMAFGFVYFIIGISIVAESALFLSGRLQQDVTETDIHDDKENDALLAV